MFLLPSACATHRLQGRLPRMQRTTSTPGLRALLIPVLAVPLTLLPTTLVGQIEKPPSEAVAPTNAVPTRVVRQNLDSLNALLQSLAVKEKTLTSLREQIKTAPDEPTRADLKAQLALIKSDYDETRKKIEDFAAGTDVSMFRVANSETFDWKDEVSELLKPIVSEIKSATAESREIEDLRSDQAREERRYEVASTAANNLKKLLAGASTPELKAHLEALLAIWESRALDANNQRTALKQQLDQRLEARQTSFLETGRSVLQGFINGRGRNLVFGILAFLTVFFGFRLINRLYRRIRPAKDARSIINRAATLVFNFLSVLGGFGAMLLVFNMAGDWFLLGIVLIFLLGLGWASINALPRYLEQIRLILNMGAVREGERLTYEGTPMHVDRLGLYARLSNPLLDGGHQPLPIRQLIGRVSRKSGTDEEWFPTRKGDWVQLPDQQVASVRYQSPQFVQLVTLGGAQIVYPTTDYLSLHLRNLSSGFRIQAHFGIDYQHQADASRIIETMEEHLKSGLAKLVGDELKNVHVGLFSAGASSLDYRVYADFQGDESPAQLNHIEDEITRLLVEACNAQGWVIPFTQITLHQAS